MSSPDNSKHQELILKLPKHKLPCSFNPVEQQQATINFDNCSTANPFSLISAESCPTLFLQIILILTGRETYVE